MVIELWDRCRAPRLPYLDVRDIREKKIPVRNTPGCLPTGTEECWRPQNTEGSVGGRWDLCALDQECEQSRCHWTSVPMQEVPGAASRQHGQGQEERPQVAPGKFRLGRKNFFTKKFSKHWNRLPRKVVEWLTSRAERNPWSFLFTGVGFHGDISWRTSPKESEIIDTKLYLTLIH